MLCCQPRRWNRADGDLEDPGEVMVADQLQRVVDPLEEAGRLDLQLADLPHGVAVQPPAAAEPAAAAVRGG